MRREQAGLQGFDQVLHREQRIRFGRREPVDGQFLKRGAAGSSR